MSSAAPLLGVKEALSPYWFAIAAGIEPDDWQAEVLRSRSPRKLLNCSRQRGKSTVTSVLAAHKALFVPRSLTLMVCPTQRQSGELFRKAIDIYNGLHTPGIESETESALQVELSNGSRIVALPGKEGTIRGYSGVDLLLLDEASRIADETYFSVRPMLAVSQGELVALSTPFGTRGWWHEEFKGDGLDANGPLITNDGWQRWRIPAEGCPRITPEFLAEEKRRLGWWWYEQEYECRFLDAKSAAFRTEDIQRMFSDDYDTWDLERFTHDTF